MYVTSLQNYQKTNETITFLDNHFLQNLHLAHFKSLRGSQKRVIIKIDILTRVKNDQLDSGVTPGQRRRGWLVESSGSAGRRRRRGPGVGPLSRSSSFTAIKSELEKEKIFEYPIS